MSPRPMPRWAAALALVCSALFLVGGTLIGSARADVVLGGSAASKGLATAGPSAPAPAPTSPPPGIYGPLIGGGTMAPPPPDATSFGSESSNPSWYDIPGQIEKAIDTWFGDLVKSALQPVLRLVASTLLSSPDMSSGRIASIWTSVAITANTIYVLFVLAGGVTVMTHGTLQMRHSAKEVLPRLLIGIIASNASLWLICQSVSLGNALSSALTNGDISAEGIGSQLTSMIVIQIFTPNKVSTLFFVLLGGAIAVMGVVLLLTCLVRVTVLMVLTAGAPLAFACHALPQTDGLAKLWWRAIIGCLATQVAQALVLMTCVQVFFDPNADTLLGLPNGGGLTDLLICLVLFLVLIKIPTWTSRIVLGRQAFGPTRVSSLARSYLQFRAFGAVGNFIGAARRPGRGSGGRGRSGSGPPSSGFPPSGGQPRTPSPTPGSGAGRGMFGPTPAPKDVLERAAPRPGSAEQNVRPQAQTDDPLHPPISQVRNPWPWQPSPESVPPSRLPEPEPRTRSPLPHGSRPASSQPLPAGPVARSQPQKPPRPSPSTRGPQRPSPGQEPRFKVPSER